ncbi:amino acid ABC transporter substrate-binding protein [Crocosphaera sp. UHCC 0190]|uniref:amino acid ABC transporter substrate-binding protein n=1 Tax=Crocosphaera sp. UHCC 0190 TaxID=3110246 RepID=UPI002B1F4CAA|nr:amino acid ABC transporter substrate-binding protein [Crocosphaera sp. UHCC 0190]MEA5508880.1 amino acid ABC transporter substrate-binding protein [Crocosphaera sp. UHCC 0190]
MMIKFKQLFSLTPLLFGLLLSLPTNAQTETVLEKINQTGLLKVGIREDAVPFGYRDINGDLNGLCLDFIAVVRGELQRKLNKKVIAIKLYKSTLFNRFELVSDRIVDLECGPNTIRAVSDYNIQFSSPFFRTGTQLLVKAENEQLINSNSTLENVLIGVLRNTSNEQLISQKYPSANQVEFQGVTGRFRGLQALQGGKIEAFASDGILLIGEALIQGLAIGKDYVLLPKYPLDCENYGLILPKNDPEWLNFVNSVIKNSASRSSFEQWFGEILPQIKAIESFCQTQT